MLLGLRCDKVEVKDICGGREMPRDDQFGKGDLNKFNFRFKIENFKFKLSLKF